MIRPAQIRKKSRARYEPPLAVKRWPEATTPAESLDNVQGRSSRRTPRAELHSQRVRVMCGATDRPVPERRWRAAHHSRQNLSGALRSWFPTKSHRNSLNLPIFRCKVGYHPVQNSPPVDNIQGNIRIFRK